MMKKEELYLITGGSFSFSASFLSYLARFINNVYNIGDSFGASIYRLIHGNRC
jgi:hypothetical protein